MEIHEVYGNPKHESPNPDNLGAEAARAMACNTTLMLGGRVALFVGRVISKKSATFRAGFPPPPLRATVSSVHSAQAFL